MSKGQISIEFVSLLALALFTSLLLMSELRDKRNIHDRSQDYEQAQRLAQKVAYKLEYAKASSNTSISLNLPLKLQDKSYNISVSSGTISINITRQGSVTYPTLYEKSKINLRSGQDYKVINNGTLNVVEK